MPAGPHGLSERSREAVNSFEPSGSNITNLCDLILETLTCFQGLCTVHEYIVVLGDDLAD